MERKIRVIVESMPRCGTHYLIRNLMQSYHLGYCTIYPATARKGQVVERKLLQGENFDITWDAEATWYIEDGGENIENAKKQYVCKTHYMNGMPNIAKKIYLWGDVLDHAWLSARLWSGERENPNFFLTADSQAFNERVGKWLDKLEEWLQKITALSTKNKREAVVRYEDMLYKPEAVKWKIEKLMGEELTWWKWPELRPYRIVHSGWEEKIDSQLASYLIKRFEKWIWKET